MPDVLLWLGIKRIDWLLSMSSDKYGAIRAAGIEVMQRISIPDDLVPESAQVWSFELIVIILVNDSNRSRSLPRSRPVITLTLSVRVISMPKFTPLKLCESVAGLFSI